MSTTDKETFRKIIELLKRAKTDKLSEFVAHGYVQDLIQMQETNFKNLMDLCNEYGLRYIAINDMEICGCEGITIKGHFSRCAVWTIAERLGFSGGCGNCDQHQLEPGLWFPYQNYGEWNVKEMRKLHQGERDTLKFHYVCGRDGYYSKTRAKDPIQEFIERTSSQS